MHHLSESKSASSLPDRMVFRICKLAMALAIGGIAPAYAQSQGMDNAEIVEQIATLRAQQAKIAEMQRQTDESIRALEARLGLEGPISPPPTPTTASVAAATSPTAAAKPETPRLKISGDLRLRAQGDFSDNDARDRTSGQLRARLGATYVVNDRITIGGRLDTGDNDDPNSSDVQLSNWDDDLQISLDLAYAQFNFGDLKLYGGKIPMPFSRTDLVWDGDVNPQGAGAVYRHALADGSTFRANGLFFVIDEQAGGPDSTMGGLQFGFSSAADGNFKYELSGGYYRYSLGSMAGADAGDWRSNRRKPDGSFLSDFELLDVMADVSWQGSNEKWPFRIVGNYVKNLGSIDDQDTGFGVDLTLGRASKAGDWRVTYGYSQTDVDAVLAAFSNDNIGIATNYKLHALTTEYTPAPKTAIGAIWYHYKPNNPLYAGSNQPGDWLDRVRVYYLINF